MECLRLDNLGRLMVRCDGRVMALSTRTEHTEPKEHTGNVVRSLRSLESFLSFVSFSSKTEDLRRGGDLESGSLRSFSTRPGSLVFFEEADRDGSGDFAFGVRR